MKTKTLIVTSLFGITLISCNQNSESGISEARKDVIESEKEVNEATEAYNTEVKNYKLDQEKTFIDNEEKIADLKERRTDVNTGKRTKYDEKINELENKNNTLREKIDNTGYESKERWESFKSEFNHDMNALGESVKDLFKDNVRKSKN